MRVGRLYTDYMHLRESVAHKNECVMCVEGWVKIVKEPNRYWVTVKRDGAVLKYLHGFFKSRRNAFLFVLRQDLPTIVLLKTQAEFERVKTRKIR
jgi:hypothetical protein